MKKELTQDAVNEYLVNHPETWRGSFTQPETEKIHKKIYEYFGITEKKDIRNFRTYKSNFVKSVNYYLDKTGEDIQKGTANNTDIKNIVNEIINDVKSEKKPKVISFSLDPEVIKAVKKQSGSIKKSNSYLVNAILRKALL